MKTVRSFFFFLFFSVSWQVYGIVREMAHFDEILNEVSEDCVVVLDIDDTLLIPSQMLGCDKWFKHRIEKYIKEGFERQVALDKALAEWEGVRHLTKMLKVEEGNEEVIAALQRKRVTLMGLTSQGMTLSDRTQHQLRAHQIDFSLTAPTTFDSYFTLNGKGILYRGGILFTSGSRKGEALFLFFEQVGYCPKQLVFVDDDASHVFNVDHLASKKGVESLSLRYSYSDQKKRAFNAEVADFQFHHSSLAHLQSDEEAINEMQKRK